MKRSLIKMLEEFRLYWKHYIVQSLLATLSVFIVLYFLSLQKAVIIASIGATAFIVFTMPDNIAAQARNVIGGHLVGLFLWICVFLVSQAVFDIFTHYIFGRRRSLYPYDGGHRYGASACGQYSAWSCYNWHIFRCIDCCRTEHSYAFTDSSLF